VINKKFEIERGGTINWNGDPYDADVNIKAIYRLRASLNELFANDEEEIYNQRIPVLCEINLSDNLNNPTIGFGIDFPSSEDRIKDEVQQFFSTNEDMNKQILSLSYWTSITPRLFKGFVRSLQHPTARTNSK